MPKAESRATSVSDSGNGQVPYRFTQRRPLACKECTRRKIKCDRQLPCSRCSRLGLSCARELVRVRSATTKHGEEIAFLNRIASELEGSIGGSVNASSSSLGSLMAGGGGGSSQVVQAAIAKVRRRVEALEYGLEVGEMDMLAGGTGGMAAEQQVQHEESPVPEGGAMSKRTTTMEVWNPSQPPHQIPTNPLGIPSEASDTDDRNSSIVNVLEYLAWGRPYGACYPHRKCTCPRHRSPSEMLSINSEPLAQLLQSSAATLTYGLGDKYSSVLPSVEDARQLVRFHLTHLVWHHNCLHSQTFLERCEVFWQTGGCDQPLWMALYLSVLSCSIYCVQNSQRFQAALGLELADKDLAWSLFRAMVDVLYTNNFLEDLSLYSVQAIVISTEVAHNLGLSQLNATLFSSAVCIAQCLGLHKIADPATHSIETSAQWHEALEREVGKRIWCQIVIQDHFAIPFTDSCNVHPTQYSTTVPSNCDDHDLIPHDPRNPTVSSYNRVLVEMARLMPELIDGLGRLGHRKSLTEQYTHVLQTDRRMRHLVSQIPDFLLRDDVSQSSTRPYLAIARRSLAITAADKIIMIHRPFLFRSFQEAPRYAYTRQTCVSAAITILREHERIARTDDISIWTHTAFCITAAVILCLELLHRVDRRGKKDNDTDASSSSTTTSDEKAAQFLAAIHAARDRLAARSGDLLAARGVSLIDSIFSTVQSTVPIINDDPTNGNGSDTSSPVNFHEIMAKFAAMSDPMGLGMGIIAQSPMGSVDSAGAGYMSAPGTAYSRPSPSFSTGQSQSQPQRRETQAQTTSYPTRTLQQQQTQQQVQTPTQIPPSPTPSTPDLDTITSILYQTTQHPPPTSSPSTTSSNPRSKPQDPTHIPQTIPTPINLGMGMSTNTGMNMSIPPFPSSATTGAAAAAAGNQVTGLGSGVGNGAATALDFERWFAEIFWDGEGGGSGAAGMPGVPGDSEGQGQRE